MVSVAGDERLGESVTRSGDRAEERGDANAQVINALKKCMHGIKLNESDIGRAPTTE